MVRKVLRRTDGATYLEVCYGTSNPTKYSAHDLYVANLADMVEMGLPQQTSRYVASSWGEAKLDSPNRFS